MDGFVIRVLQGGVVVGGRRDANTRWVQGPMIGGNGIKYPEKFITISGIGLARLTLSYFGHN